MFIKTFPLKKILKTVVEEGLAIKWLMCEFYCDFGQSLMKDLQSEERIQG